MCVDIGYLSSLGPDGLPRLIKGVKINRDLIAADHDQPHLRAHARPDCIVVYRGADNIPVADKMHWGLVADFMINNPVQMKKYGNQLFNARSERVLEEGSIWFKLKENRCLLVADGVYEHQQVEGRKQKLPWYIRLRSGDTLLLPALFNPKTNSLALLTRQGNGLFRTIHNSGPNKFRMPLFLTTSMANSWIEPGLGDGDIQKLFEFEYPSSELRAYTIFSIRSGSPRPDGKAVNEYYNWDREKLADQGSLF